MVARETSLSQGLSEMGIQASSGAVGRLAGLTEILATEGIEKGFLGPKEASRILPRHVLESACLLPLLPDEGDIVDVGSGAGLPGLVLAGLGRPVTLVESLERRAEFLRHISTELGLASTVICGRAEDVGRSELRDSFSAVVARALADLPVAFELCLPLCRVGGWLAMLASPPEGSGGLDSISEQLGGAPAEWIERSVPGADGSRWVIIVRKIRPTPERFPRRPGVPKRRPLGGKGVTPVN
jgi:16S rRNA (guanine527-N7)-methyltransferase